MPRSTVIASQISKYDKIINDNRTIPDTELAIFKLAICQLVDAAFGGGGGGGGSTSSATIAEGINDSLDIEAILARLTTIATNTSASAPINIYRQLNQTVTGSGLLAVAANPTRKGMLLINRSTTNTIDLFLHAPSTPNTFGVGLPLLPAQSYEINSTNLYLGQVSAKTGAGLTAELSIMESLS